MTVEAVKLLCVRESQLLCSCCRSVFRKHNIIVLSDEIYSRLNYAHSHQTLTKVSPHTHTRTHRGTMRTRIENERFIIRTQAMCNLSQFIEVSSVILLKWILIFKFKSNYTANSNISVLPRRHYTELGYVQMGECWRMEGKYFTFAFHYVFLNSQWILQFEFE